MKKILLIFTYFLVFGFGCTFAQTEKLTEKENKFLDTLQYKTFLYFINEVNFNNGLVRDRSTKESPASMAATGFAIPVWAIGVEHNWITIEQARDLTLNLFIFLLNSEQSEKEDATGYEGLYYHFVDINTGKRMWNCELSTIDTGLLLAGIRFAVQYFSSDNPKDIEIRKLGDKITNRVNWNFTCVSEEGNFKSTISMSWDPKDKLSKVGWHGYNEALIMYVLAAGSNYTNINEAYNNWLKPYIFDEPYEGLKHILFPPLFGHQYSHIFIDFRNIYDEYTDSINIDYFENSRRAVYTQQKYAIENPYKFVGYDSLTWGITACDGPGQPYNTPEHKFEYYSGRGTSGAKYNYFDDGTIAPTAAAASIAFAPEIVTPTIINMYEKYGNKGLWGKYGFVDAFNPTAGWFAKDYIGIDQAPIVLMIENYRNGFVWNYCKKDPVIKKGLEVLKFRGR
ncbi:MAG: glucoamylase family protein [bacterium]